MGIISNETDTEIELNQPGGGSTTLARSNVKAKETSDASLMPALSSAMSEQELVDLVTYLSSLH
jgi:putative heme-binding domain-containing protein